jgi:hypothetical protein
MASGLLVVLFGYIIPLRSGRPRLIRLRTPARLRNEGMMTNFMPAESLSREA